MSDHTKIQWCHSTVNPIMGCGGCELFPHPAEILNDIDRTLSEMDGYWEKGQSKQVFRRLVKEAFANIANPLAGHSRAITTTNIWHFRNEFAEAISATNGTQAGQAVDIAIRKAITCYAAFLHLNKGRSLLNPMRHAHKGYAPNFEMVTRFHDRVRRIAGLKDLAGIQDPEKPWANGLPRLIFVSDMGDAFSSERDFSFLENEVIAPILSDEGKRHMWLWLTKRPERMARFARKIGGFPPNVCAMTTVTGPSKIERIAQLQMVPAHVRGLSIEPLWDHMPAAELDLSGISWVIVGGESGKSDSVRPFATEWAEEIREHCRQKGVAFFLKQLGRVPTKNGRPLVLRDKHGGDWTEWPAQLRTRQFPRHFRDFRGSTPPSAKLQPILRLPQSQTGKHV